LGVHKDKKPAKQLYCLFAGFCGAGGNRTLVQTRKP